MTELKVHSGKCSMCNFGVPGSDVDLPWNYNGTHDTYTIANDPDNPGKYIVTDNNNWHERFHDVYYAIAAILRFDNR